MKLKDRISAFAALGGELGEATGCGSNGLAGIVNAQSLANAWFTPENVMLAISSIARNLTRESIEEWLAAYHPALTDKHTHPITTAVIMAGNIPLAGFHDFMCTLITGNRILAKTSSKDHGLIIYIAELLCRINPAFGNLISFAGNGALSGFDAVIATGSSNTSRYFEYYFGKYPCIIRKNRNSIAVIDGSETEHELHELGHDIFSYFGLGCRNVSKIYIPAAYPLDNLTRRWEYCAGVVNNNKYANNYDFHKAIFMVNRNRFTDTGYLLLKEETAISSPVAVLYYEYYSTAASLEASIEKHRSSIQCTVSKNAVAFGQSQHPRLYDYADGVDTIDFLLKTNTAKATPLHERL